jgi:uncharacterized phiE125 gp8 family phage protein
MSDAIVIPPYAEPLHLSEMKGHLKQDLVITEDDALIVADIIAARNLAEFRTGENTSPWRCKAILATTFDQFFDGFYGTRIVLSRVPLISVTSITYVDTDGVTQTLSTSYYTPDTVKGKIDLAYGQTWPSTRCQPNAVTVRFVAGMVATFTADATTDTPTFQGRTFATDDRIRLMNSGGQLPGGLVANTDYFIRSDGKLALTSGGSGIDITNVGSGTHFAALDLSGFESLRAAIKLIAAVYYRERQGVVMDRGSSPEVLPMGVDALIGAQHA